MSSKVKIIGGGLAGSEAALFLAERGIGSVLYEMRPETATPVHKTGDYAELVCSNSLKSTKPDSAAGMLKHELEVLESPLYRIALEHRVPAGGALAVDREAFSSAVTKAIDGNPLIEPETREVHSVSEVSDGASALILATGPLTSDALSSDIADLVGSDALAFYDAAAPIVMADSLDMGVLFRQSRYEDSPELGDYLNAPFDKDSYDEFIDALVSADRVISKDFENAELFQACQPIEEIAKKGHDAPRFGPMKPVGLTDPATGRRPWAALQLRAEDRMGQSYNLVGFQTNLTFPEQRRVFRMIPGLENAEFARYGVMHRNTYMDSPSCLLPSGRLRDGFGSGSKAPIFVAGQLSGTEGYCEAIRSGLNVAISITCMLDGKKAPGLPEESAFGALMGYATDPETKDYQPMHVNFGILPPFEQRIRNKAERYRAYSERGASSIESYKRALEELGIYGSRRS